MAFVAVEDRYAEGECILFSARYAAFSHLLRKDNAVLVSGTLSFREDEAPKILVAYGGTLIALRLRTYT